MTDKLYLSAQGQLEDSFKLGSRILKSGFKPKVIIAIWRGGAPIGIAVQEILEYFGIKTDHIAIRTSSYGGDDIRVAVPWYKPSHNKTERVPDYYLHTTEQWLKFPFSLEGLTIDEIQQNRPSIYEILAPVVTSR